MDVTKILVKEGLLSEAKQAEIIQFEKTKPLSLHWELRVLLYIGVLLFISGIGILVYENIDTIGHQFVLAFILIACAAGFYYSIKMRKPYTHSEVKNESPFPDYAILLSCLLLGVFIGYLQGAYDAFGYHYGLATLIPASVYFVCAYIFDHKGVLSLGITGIAAWAGVSVTPKELLMANDFSSLHIIITAIIIGLLYTAAAWYSHHKKIKPHFAFTYNNFAINILFIAILAALFTQHLKILSFILLAGITWYYILLALNQSSFLFLFLSVLYSYIGLTYYLMEITENIGYSEVVAMFWMLYFIGSCVGIILFFIFYKRILKKRI